MKCSWEFIVLGSISVSLDAYIIKIKILLSGHESFMTAYHISADWESLRMDNKTLIDQAATKVSIAHTPPISHI